MLHFCDHPTHRCVFHLAGRRWTLELNEGGEGEAPRSHLVLLGPGGSFDPALLDATIGQCTAARPTPTSASA